MKQANKGATGKEDKVIKNRPANWPGGIIRMIEID